MFFGVFFVVIVMQKTDGLPVLYIFAEVFCQAAHGVHNIFGVQDKVRFADHCGVQFLCSFQCKHFIFSFYVK